MPDIIRPIRLDETVEMERFLERCFCHGWGFFSKEFPHLAGADPETADCYLILEHDGKIASHVGTYPMEIVAGPARVLCGGIGGVATLPEFRGEGFMGRLLEASVQRMRERGMFLSALWGDQQRYGSFGWETCGVLYVVRLSRRSMGWHQVEPADVREVDPAGPEALEAVSRLHPTLEFRVERPHLPLMLRREGIRVFVGSDGYVISRGATAGDLQLAEVVSPAGHEAELILGALNISGGDSARIELGSYEGERSRRLVALMSGWNASPQGMLRINDWPGLLQALAPLLAERAAKAELAPFRQESACRWGDMVEAAAVEWDGNALQVEKIEASSAPAVDARPLVAALLGSPGAPGTELGSLGRLLPVPLHISAMDRV